MNTVLAFAARSRTCAALRSVTLLAAAVVGTSSAFAAQTDISSTPFTSTTSAQAKPNIMLLMDTSGSMGWGHMPDEVETATGTGSVGYKAAQCNVLYYNRNQKYDVPKKPDGSLFPTPSFSNARYAGYGDYYVTPDTSTVNLGTNFLPFETSTLRVPPAIAAVPGPAYYYYYTGPQTLSYAAAPCTDTDNLAGNASKGATGGGTWTRVEVSSNSGVAGADERGNFAIWYSYYRIRISLTKSAASLAFTPLTDSFRVGFITVKPKDTPTSAAINPAKYLPIADFNSTQRSAWFDKLFSQAPDGSSPAREGLARVGRHYAGKTDGINSGMTGDPVQYSCQQNFTIMTTDGYWNAQAETPGRGAVDIDGNTLTLNQDGDLSNPLSPRPIWDGASTKIQTTRDASNFYRDAPCMGSALLRTTSQQLASTKQFTAATAQTTRNRQQYRTSTTQALQSTQQYTSSTVQTNRTTQQYTLSTLQYLQGTTQFLASTTQRQRVTQQYTTSTRQIYATTRQYTRSTQQTKKTTLQYSTATSQTFSTTYQRQLATQQYNLGQTQQTRRQIQIISYNALTELGTPVASCTPGGNITCQTREVTPTTPVASCTAGSTNAPNYIVTQCATTTLSAVTPVSSCTPGVTNSGSPNFITSTCTSTTTAAAFVSTCTPGTSNSGAPNYITSTCTNVPLTTNVAVASCSNGTTAGPNFVTTACTTTTSAATPSAPCTVGTSGGTTSPFIRTVCTKSIDTPNVNVANTPVCTNQTASSTNSWINITCATTTVAAAPINSICTAGTTVNGAFLYTTCAVNTLSANAPIAATTCTTGFGAAPNYIYTLCSPTAASTPAGVSSCTPGVTVGAAPNYIQTTCAFNNNAVFLPVATACTPQLPLAGNNYVRIDCNTFTTPPTPVASCTLGTTNNGAPNWVYTTCTQVTVPPTPVATCVPGTTNSGPPNYTATTCTTTATPPVGVLTCVPGTTTGPAPGFIRTTCAYSNVTVPVAAVPACANQTAGPGNQFVTIGCTTVTTPTVNTAACTPGTTVNGAFVYTTCTRTDVSTNVPVASCTAGTAPSPSFLVTTCPTPVTTPAVGVASCTPGTTVSAAPNFIQTTCTFSNTDTFVADAAACTPSLPAAGNNYVAINCSTAITPPTNVASCIPGSTTTGSPSFMNTTCVEVPGSPPTPVADCDAGVGPGPAFVTTTCSDGPGTGPTPVLACANGNSGAPDFITTSCATGPAPGLQRVFDSTITSSIQNYSGSIPVGSPSSGSPITITGQATDGVCYITGLSTPPALPVPNPYRPAPTEQPLATASAATCTTGWPCITSVSVDGGSINSLADVAQYYYVTDLRPGPLWPNTGPLAVPSIGTNPEDDRATWQHMTTFTIALGVSGTLNYRSDYRSSAATTGDFADIRLGSKGWPIWPDPNTNYSNPDNWNNPRSIDDYWHTAVNGRGQYFSAGNPTSVIAGLSGALAGITARLASGASAGASSLQPTAGDNFAFVASYVTSKWTGELRAELIDLSTGAIGTTTIDPLTNLPVPGAPVWSAQARLDGPTGLVGAACDNRNIYLFRTGATDNKVNFSWNTQACDAAYAATGAADNGLNATERAYFTGANISVLSQYPSMTDGSSGSVDQRTAASGANLVNFLRGQRGNEGFEAGTANRLYRDREHVLGDIVNAQPVYVKGPFGDYTDPGYQAFKTSNASRTPMVYAAANDGMLHAFYAGTSVNDPDGGKEAWALIPSTVLPNLYKLADANYKNTHQYSVDGTPTVADIYDSGTGTWKTQLVGGLNSGGKGYYAVDVTNPIAPKGMWEFKWSTTCYDNTPATAGSDCHLGYTFSRPLISKLANGTWVVMFTSGYNNISAPAVAGDGVGYLYVLNAVTGKIIHKLTTGVGDATTPSGLGQINNFVDSARVNNTTLRVYGGDMLGNVWRFDVNDNLAPAGYEASLIGVATSPVAVGVGAPQPITVRPELAEIDGKPMVFVSTGRLLGASDVTDLQTQSIYGIVDPMTGNPSYANMRGALRPMAMTEVVAGASTYRTVSCSGTPAQCAATNGWVVDLPDSGERVNVNMELVLGTLIVASNVPQSSACSSGGYGWINYLDFRSGEAVGSGAAAAGGAGAVGSGLGGINGNGGVSVRLDGGLIVGTKTIQLPNQNKDFKTLIRMGDGSNREGTPPPPPLLPQGNRISWREITPQ